MKILGAIGFFIIHLIVLLLYKKYIRTFDTIHDIWYINMDRSTERRTYMEQQLKGLHTMIPYQRWPGVNGHLLTDTDYNRLEIPAWARPEFTIEARQKIRKGEIGCYLSHLTLLKHLQKIHTHANKGHLILEDDISIDPNFFSKVEKAFSFLPSNWDILTLGLADHGNNNHVINIRNHIGETIWMNNNFAYLVKHSSLAKIIEQVSVISEPFDTTLGRASKLGKLNIYSYVPPLVTPRNENDTTMNGN